MRHEIQGQYATAVIYGNYPDATEIKDLYALLSTPLFEGSKIRIMPDHHAGKGCMIGFTCVIDMGKPRIIPNIIGVDIGCGVLGICLPKGRIPLDREEHFAAFDVHLRKKVPFGMTVRSDRHPDLEEIFDHHVQKGGWEHFQAEVFRICSQIKIDSQRVFAALGTLGSGNHFIEIGEEVSIDEVEGDCHWLTIHSGSRRFGLQVCQYHQKKAMAACHGRKDLAWLEGEDALEYLRDMRVAQQYANLNRWVMARELLGAWKLRFHEKLNVDYILSVHNFIAEDNTIRKGAISAREGEKVLIPWNMRDGLIIGEGKGNVDWNYSAPHGAGRLMSRGEAKRSLSLPDFKQQMQEAGIWTSCVCKDTLDEAPDAYKSASEVLATVVDTLAIHSKVRTRYNFKATNEQRR